MSWKNNFTSVAAQTNMANNEHDRGNFAVGDLPSCNLITARINVAAAKTK